MAEQAVSQFKSVRPRLAVPSVAALRARAWKAGPPLLLGLLAALIAVLTQGTAWRGKAEVSFNLSNAQLAPGPLYLVGADGDPFRAPATSLEGQVRRARSPVLARRVVRAARVPGVTAAEFLRHSSAKPEPDADVLKLSVSDRSRAPAVRLSKAYASEFVRFANELNAASVDEALGKLRSQIEKLRRGGQTETPVYAASLKQQQVLETFGSMLPNVRVLRAEGPSSFRPHALRSGLIGGAIGVLLGVALVGVVTRQRRLRRSKA